MKCQIFTKDRKVVVLKEEDKSWNNDFAAPDKIFEILIIGDTLSCFNLCF